MAPAVEVPTVVVSSAKDGQLQIDKGKLENRPGQREQGEFFLPFEAA